MKFKQEKRSTNRNPIAGNAGHKRQSSLLILLVLPFAPASQALAYVGPGAGLGAIGTVIALIGALLLGILGFVWYPIKRLLRRRKRPSPETESVKRESIDTERHVNQPDESEPASPKS